MKKILILSVLLLLVVGLTTGCVSQSGVSTKDWKTLKSPESSNVNVSIKYPGEWKNNGFFGTSSGTIAIFYDESGNVVGSADYAANWGLLQREFDNVVKEDLVVNGKDAIKEVGTDTKENKNLVQLIIPSFAVADGNEMSFRFLLEVTDENSFEIFDEMVKTIKF